MSPRLSLHHEECLVFLLYDSFPLLREITLRLCADLSLREHVEDWIFALWPWVWSKQFMFSSCNTAYMFACLCFATNFATLHLYIFRHGFVVTLNILWLVVLCQVPPPLFRVTILAESMCLGRWFGPYVRSILASRKLSMLLFIPILFLGPRGRASDSVLPSWAQTIMRAFMRNDAFN